MPRGRVANMSLIEEVLRLHHECGRSQRELARSCGGPLALRDRALLMLLYNSGARAQEAADLRVGDVDLDGPYRVRLHGKGDKWRICPLWPETADLPKRSVGNRIEDASAPVFASRSGRPLTRFGIYKAVCRHARARAVAGATGREAPSRPMYSATQLPCTCSAPGSTSTPFARGWVMSLSRRPTDTLKSIWP